MNDCNAVALTLADAGALLATAEDQFRIGGLEVEPISPVGGGDSFIGAMTLALEQGALLRRGFLYGMAAGQTATDLPKGVGTGQMTKEHRYQLGPAGKSLRLALRLVFDDQMRKFGSGKVMKQLTKQTRYLYHGFALCGNCDVFFARTKILHHNSPGGHFV